MFHGCNKMMLAVKRLQEAEKQVICITKALCRGRFKSLKIGYNFQLTIRCGRERRHAKRCLLDCLVISLLILKVWCFDNNMKVTNFPRTGPTIKFR